jgi:hypothetical protein
MVNPTIRKGWIYQRNQIIRVKSIIPEHKL